MEAKTVLCFGDSNTYGHRPDGGGRFPPSVRWTGRLAALLGSEYRVVEEGYCGRTTVYPDYVEGRMSGVDYLPTCLASHTPLSLVIIMLGTNDLKERYSASAATVATSLERLVYAVRSAENERLPAPKVLLVAPPLITTAYLGTVSEPIFGGGCMEKSREMGREIQKKAELLGCAFLNAASVTEPSRLDGVHLDEDGHAALAHALADAVRALV